MRQEILRLLRKAGDHYLSGEEIAETLGVSRTAIWKHIKELRRAGYDIVSQAHSGYRLEKSPDLLTPAEIAPLLIMAKLESFDYPSAAAIAIVMMAASFLVLLALNGYQRWRMHHQGV